MRILSASQKKRASQPDECAYPYRLSSHTKTITETEIISLTPGPRAYLIREPELTSSRVSQFAALTVDCLF